MGKLIKNALILSSIALAGCTAGVPDFEDLSSLLGQIDDLQSPSNDLTPTLSLSGMTPGDSLQIYLDGECSGVMVGSGVASSSGTVSITVDSLPGEGTYNFYAKHGEHGCLPDGVEYVVDISTPVILGLKNDFSYVAAKQFFWSCSENDCLYRYVIDQDPGTLPGGSYGTDSSATQTSGSGVYYLHIQVKDGAGNEGEVEHYTFNIAPIPPFAPSGLSVVVDSGGAVGISNTPTIKVQGVNAGDTVELFSDSGCTTSMGAGVALSSEVEIVSAAIVGGDGIYSYWAQSTNLLNQTSPCSMASTTYTLVASPPTLYNLYDDAVATRSKFWSWWCNRMCTYRFTIDNSETTLPSGDYEPIGSITYYTPTDGLYYIHVQAKDQYGFESEVTHVSAVMLATPPAPELEFASGTSSPSATNSTPEFVLSNLTMGLQLKIYRGGCASGTLEVDETIAQTTKNYTMSAVPSDGYYNYYATVHDGVVVSECKTLQYIYDATAPVNLPIFNPSAHLEFSFVGDPNNVPDFAMSSYGYDIGTYKIEARIVRDSDSFVVLDWTEYEQYWDGGQSWGSLKGNGVFSLAAGESYHYEARVVNTVGMASSAVVGVDAFTYDDTPPSSPGTPSFGASVNSLSKTPVLDFSSANDPDSGISHYEVQVYHASNNAILSPWSRFEGVLNVDSHEFEEIMSNSASYYVKVRAVNQAGLSGVESPASPSWSPGCTTTTMSVSGNSAFSSSDGHFCFVVPVGVSSIQVKAWGAGGGGAVASGGGGGFVAGTVAVTPGELLLVTVGSGGQRGEPESGGKPAYGGGGKGSEVKHPYNWGAGGGGYTGLFRQALPLLIAAGGGGGQGDVTPTNFAGAGGGLIGDNDSDPDGGKGGTQVAGGAPSVDCGEPGSYLNGGDAGILTNYWGGGGGGGGGYLGGGGGCRGGTGLSTSGGGGSSYYDGPGVSSQVTQSGLDNYPFGSAEHGGSDTDRVFGGAPANVGYGGVLVQDGGRGHIKISW